MNNQPLNENIAPDEYSILAADASAIARKHSHHSPELAAALHRHAADLHLAAYQDRPVPHGKQFTFHDKEAAKAEKAVTKTNESTVNEGTPDESKAGPEVMDPKTKKMKDDANKNVKAEEAPYTNKADGSENIVPADKPVAKPSAMPKLTQKEALRTVADAYTEMLKTAKK